MYDGPPPREEDEEATRATQNKGDPLLDIIYTRGNVYLKSVAGLEKEQGLGSRVAGGSANSPRRGTTEGIGSRMGTGGCKC
jgi:hypothetical protein